MFKFKTPSQKTLKQMSEVAKGENTKNFEQSCIDKMEDGTDLNKLQNS